MTTPDGTTNDLRPRLVETLERANTPLTVEAYDPAETLDAEIGLYDERFDTTVYLDESRLEHLLDDRPARAVTTSLENLSAAYAIADAVEAGNPYGGGQTVSTVAQRFSNRALDQGIMTLTAEGDHMRIEVPIADVANVPPPYSPERMASRAVEVMENELDRLTGTTLVERLEMTTPVGRQIEDGTLTMAGQEASAHFVEMGARLGLAFEATNSPLGGTPTSAIHDNGEMGFLDSRFYTTMYLSLDQIEELLESRPVEDVVSSLENLSAAREIADAVMSGAHHGGKDEVHLAAGNLTENALNHGVIRLHSDPDNMTVDVPIESISFDPIEQIGFKAVHAMEDKVHRITAATSIEHLEGTADRPSPFEASPFEASPFGASDPFTSPSDDQIPDTFTSAPSAQSEIEPGHSPGM